MITDDEILSALDNSAAPAGPSDDDILSELSRPAELTPEPVSNDTDRAISSYLAAPKPSASRIRRANLEREKDELLKEQRSDSPSKFITGRTIDAATGMNLAGAQLGGVIAGVGVAGDKLSEVNNAPLPLSPLSFPIVLLKNKTIRNTIKEQGRLLRDFWTGEANKKDEIVAGLGEGAIGDVGGVLTKTAVSSAPALPAAVIGGMPLAVAAAGAQSFGSTFNDATEAYKKQGMKAEEAENNALLPAAASGAATSIITFAFGKTGIESLAKFATTPASKVAKEVGAKNIRDVAYNALKEFFSEAAEESLDQAAQSVVQAVSYNPNITFSDAVTQSLQAGLAGGLLGGVSGGLGGVVDARARRSRYDTIVKARGDIKKLASVLEPAAEPITPPPIPDESSVRRAIVPPAPSVEKTPDQFRKLSKLGARILIGRGVEPSTAEEFGAWFAQRAPIVNAGEEYRSQINTAFDAAGLKSNRESNTYKGSVDELTPTGITGEDAARHVARHQEVKAEIEQRNAEIISALSGKPPVVNAPEIPVQVAAPVVAAPGVVEPDAPISSAVVPARPGTPITQPVAPTQPEAAPVILPSKASSKKGGDRSGKKETNEEKVLTTTAAAQPLPAAALSIEQLQALQDIGSITPEQEAQLKALEAAPAATVPKPSKAKKDTKATDSAPIVAPRALDTISGPAFGPAYDETLGQLPWGKDADTWLTRATRGSSVEGNKDKAKTRNTLVLRDNQSGELVEVGIYNNPKPYLIDPVTGKGKDAKDILRRPFGPQGAERYTVVASLRYSVPEKGVRRVTTDEELLAKKTQWRADSGSTDEGNVAIEGVTNEGAPIVEAVSPDVGVTPSAESEFFSLMGGMLRDPKTGGMRKMSSAEITDVAVSILNDGDHRDIVMSQISDTLAPLLADPRFSQSSRVDQMILLRKALAQRIQEYYDSESRRSEVPKGSGPAIDGAAGPAPSSAKAIEEPPIDVSANVAPAEPQRKQPVSALDRADALLTKGIDALAVNRKNVSGYVLPVWIFPDAARTALIAVRSALRAGRVLADAINEGIQTLRSLQGFNEAEARAWVQAAADEDLTVESPRVAHQVLGETIMVLGKEHTLTDSDVQLSSDTAKQILDDVGIAAELVSEPVAGQPPKAMWVWKITGEPQAQLDLKGRRLAERMRAEVAKLRGSEVPPKLGALINSISRNYFLANSSMSRMSEGVRGELFSVARDEAAYRGALLGELSRFRESTTMIARNADVYLAQIREDAFGGNGAVAAFTNAVRDEVIKNGAEEVKHQVAEIPEVAAIPGIAEIIDAVANQNNGNLMELEAALNELLKIQPGITGDVASQVATKIAAMFRIRARVIAVAALRNIQKRALTLEQRKAMRIRGAIWIKLRELFASGVFDTADTIKVIAAEMGMRSPTPVDLEKLRRWSAREESLMQVTPEDIDNAGGDEAKARIVREEAVRPEREALLKQIEAMWARYAKPTSFNPLRYFNATYRKNNAAFINEWISANLLFRQSFLTKQGIDVFSTLAIGSHTRAIGDALVKHRNDITDGKPTTFWRDVASGLTQSYQDGVSGFMPAVRASRSSFVGRTRGRNVDRLMSGQAAIERIDAAYRDAWNAAEEAQRAGNTTKASALYGKAAALRMIGVVKFSYRVAQSLDFFVGSIVETQEIRKDVIRRMRAAGKTRLEAETQADNVIRIDQGDHLQAIAFAKGILEAGGKTPKQSELNEAADRILMRMRYEKARALGLNADDMISKNDLLKNTMGWNEDELLANSPGAVVGRAVRGTGQWLEEHGIPIAAGRFSNAIAIGINRLLHHTPAGFLPGLFGGERNAWFYTETDRAQRKVEAAVGTMLGAGFMALALSGKMIARTMWPKDKEERDMWEREGRKPGNVEVVMEDGSFIPISLSTGPMRLVAPWLAAGTALRELFTKREKAQQRLNDDAAKMGIIPGKIKPLSTSELLGAAVAPAYSMVMGGRTSAGLVGSLTDYGTLNLNKIVASQTSSMVPFLPEVQELSRMSGVTLDSKVATIWDFMLPLSTSPARRVNFLGEPAETPNDLQRIIQTLTGGTYGIVRPGDAKESGPYAALFSSGYRPPSITPGRGYPIAGSFRPLNDEELQRYTVQRGVEFKRELESLGPDADKRAIGAAFKRANARALSDVGVSVAEPSQPAQDGSPSVRSRTSGRTVSSGRSSSASLAGSRISVGSRSGSRIGRSVRSRGRSTRIRSSTRQRGLGRSRVPKVRGSRLRRVK